MDENPGVADELHKIQSNITSLFESLVNEKNKFKHERDKSASYIDGLVNEVTNLRKENELLRKSNIEKRRACETCAELKEKLTIQNRRCGKLEKNLSILRKFINEVPSKVPSPQFPKLLIKLLDKLGCDESQGKLPVQGDTNFVRSASESNTKSLTDEQACDTLHKLPKPTELNSDGCARSSSDKVSDEQPRERRNEDLYVVKIKTERIEDEINMEKECGESTKSVESTKEEFRTPKKVDKSDADFIDSPFSSIAVRKEERSPLLLNRGQGPASPNQFKRKASELASGSPGKILEKKLFLKSPNQKNYRSPGKGSKSKFTSNLKFTNSVEAEISLGGVRKLKQTQLNLEFYKGRNNEDNNVHAENITDRNVVHEMNEENKHLGEDDVILGSPRHMGNPFEEFIKNFRMREQEGDKNQNKSSAKPGDDPEETFVNSFYLKENEPRRQSEEPKSPTNSPPKAPSRSPEYNSVPFLYKGSPVRKKSERMKLPGQICMECNKYYKAVLGEIDQEKMQDILNQCSKHRDKHYNVVHTPQGYWKPFLTATMDSTMQDHDTFLDK